jgi:DNA-binding transcriptional regulator YiaG
MAKWYAALRDREDTDWGYGSLERTKAEKMALDMESADAYIAVIDDSDDPVCIGEIHQDDFLISKSIKEICKMAGMSQNAMADHFMIPRRTFGNWCTGERECPMYTKMMMIELLGLSQR